MRLKPPKTEWKIKYIEPIQAVPKNVYYGDEGITQNNPKNNLVFREVLIILGIIVVYLLFKKFKGGK